MQRASMPGGACSSPQQDDLWASAPAVAVRPRPCSNPRTAHEKRGSDVPERGSESENPAIPAPEPAPSRPRTNRDWWPSQPDLRVLHQHNPRTDPMGGQFNYAEAFKSLDVEALKRDITEVMTTSQDWW